MSLRDLRLVNLVFLTCFVSGCALPYWEGSRPNSTSSSVAVSSSLPFEAIRSENQKKLGDATAEFDRAHLEKALRVASQNLIRRDPSLGELTRLSGGLSAYREVIREYLSSAEFYTTQTTYYRNYFEMSGTEAGVNFDEPTNMALALIKGDRDFREILTSDKCVNNDGISIACSTFRNPADAAYQAAGVLTTQGFLKKWQAPFNFRRVDRAFRLFSCGTYPDARDAGMTEAEIAGDIKTFNSTTSNPVCFNCHKTMNPRAVLFYAFDRNGFFNTAPSNAERTLRDNGSVSVISDLLVRDAAPRYHGKTVMNLRDYAQRFSKTKHFRDCLAQRMVNLMMGRDALDTLPSAFQDVRDDVEFNEFKIKKILEEIATHPGFINR